jgi:hypothetical protein
MEAHSMPPSILTTFRWRVYPSKRVVGATPIATPLSILDATVVTYSPTAGVWIFEAPSESRVFGAVSLRESLAVTLDAYPQWAGRLWWTPYDPTGKSGHHHRYHRPQISWGTQADPGVEFVAAECAAPLAECVPDATTRVTAYDGWDAGFMRDLELLPDLTGLPFRDASAPENPGAPGLMIQVTAFACGGAAIGVAFAHALADATTLRHFVSDWAAVHCARLAEEFTPTLTPVFDPALLDAQAAGDTNADAPDAALIAKVDRLPLHHYDWWNSGANAPDWARTSIEIPREYVAPPHEKPGVPLPWNEWNTSVFVERSIFHFTPAAIARMHASASVGGARVSRLDALLAFIWALNVRARELKEDPGDVHLDMTLGMRARTRPALPDAFVGSPLIGIVATLPATALAASEPDPPRIASAIRAVVGAFDDPEVLPAYLYDRAFAGAPHTRWIAFLGTRHSLITSWLGLGAYTVDFGTGVAPRHVESVMPDVDGCIQIMEAGLGGARDGKWYEEPVGVRMHLRTDVMQRLKADPMLHMYE